LVGFSGVPTPLADEEIESLRCALAEGLRAEPHPYLKVGLRVRIVAGPLAGREGILKRWKGNLRVLLSIDLIQCSILADVDASSVVPLHQRKVAN
jgi:transcription antitermination factor NusG